MNILRISLVAAFLLMMAGAQASEMYSSSRYIRNPTTVKRAAHAPAKKHAAAPSGPVVQSRPQPHVETLPATMLARPAGTAPAAGMAAAAEPRLTSAQETELRWRLYSYP